jgi:hypothetical protein
VNTIQNQKNTKRSITDCRSRWFIYLPLGLKGRNAFKAKEAWDEMAKVFEDKAV